MALWPIGGQPETAPADMPMRLGIVGGGRAAWAFGRSWQAAGQPLSGVLLRETSLSRLPDLLGIPRLPLETLLTKSDVVLAAVSDDSLPSLASRLANAPPSAAIFHASGSLPSSIFGSHPLRFSLHPLRALPLPGQPVSLEGALLTFEGTSAARTPASAIGAALSARMIEIDPQNKLLYHSAAVLGANDVAALLEVATEVMERAGVAPGLARQSLADLARSAIAIWEHAAGPERFTGPAARGDQSLIRRHLDALAPFPEAAELYRLLAERILRARQ